MTSDDPEAEALLAKRRGLSHRGCNVHFLDGGVVVVPQGPSKVADPDWNWRTTYDRIARLGPEPPAWELGRAVQRALTCDAAAFDRENGLGTYVQALRKLGIKAPTILERSSRSCAVKDLGERIDIHGYSAEPYEATETESCDFDAQAIGGLLLSLRSRCPLPAPLVTPRPGRSFASRKPGQSTVDGGTPATFGYKTWWLVVDSLDASAVAETLGLRETRPAEWDVDPYSPGGVFVSPSGLGWTFILGHPIHEPGDPRLADLLRDLSRRFGEAQFYVSHRVVELQGWARAVDGEIIRAYGWHGEHGEVFWDEGPLTQEEQVLGFGRFVDQSTVDGDWGDRTTPDEQDVMDLAGRWSVTPQELAAYDSEGPGVLGKLV
ncbi:hypothetical protein [Planctomyces sp. SH-PL62]|uniref:hypothetical protein n=1 Tax=Planctomyces sp. SH-PL62 TaxID=1636152 RepID=UPI00078CA301|nr:hypothetical protein [Planctomyces sp. SH-PL62]AMV37016.1 hypothetical protein VT85_06265 [Planctomyces sp. SH-PL62]